VGNTEGDIDGSVLGMTDGTTLGEVDGSVVGATLGETVGISVVGITEGRLVVG
jgi:hypothetical protein